MGSGGNVESSNGLYLRGGALSVYLVLNKGHFLPERTAGGMEDALKRKK